MLSFAIVPGCLTTLATLGAFQFTGAVKLVGVIVGLIVGLATIAGILYGAKWKVAAEVERKAREGEAALNQALDERNLALARDREDLTVKLEEATNALLEATARIARLEPLGDMARVLQLVTDSFERLVNRQEEMHTENRDGLRTIIDRLDQRAA